MKRLFILAAALMLAGSYMHAQEARPLRDSDEVACRTSHGLERWLPADTGGADERQLWLMELRRITRELALQCEESKALSSEDARVRQSWIGTNQFIEHSLRRALMSYASTAQRTPAFRTRAKLLEDLLEDMFFDVAALQTREFHRLNNRPEVVRTVEVPAPCSAPPQQAFEPPPPPRDPCADTLRQATRRWYGMATDILGPYGENGRANEAYQVVVQVRREINSLSSDDDVFAAAISWHQRLHRAANDPANVKRGNGVWDFFQLSASEQSSIDGLARDIRSQLRLCRHYVED